MSKLNDIKHIGSGIGFRPELKAFIFLNRDKIDFLEIIADHYIDAPPWKMDELKMLKEHFTIIPHAINLSLGSSQGIQTEYLHKLSALINYLQPPYWSEHISYTQAHGMDVGHLSPVIFNEEFLGVMQKNLRVVQQVVRCPLILENITYHVELPGKTYSDSYFLNELTRSTNTGLLLDLTNLYINSVNFSFDPYQVIDELDPDRIVQLHYVGYEGHSFQTIDTHAQETQKEIFDLMEYVCNRRMPQGVLLERDDRFEFTAEITKDLIRSKEIIKNRINEDR